MKRLCLIGNSHLAALKLGWDRLRSTHQDTALTFFGSRRPDSCGNLRLSEGSLIPTDHNVAQSFLWTSGGSAEIRLNEFDCFVVAALRFGPQRVTDVARTFSFVDFRLDQSKRLISRECFVQAIIDGLLDSIAAATAEKIRAGTDRPILLVPQAGHSVEIMRTEEFRATFRGTPEACWPLFGALWTECASNAAAKLGVEIAFQPRETIRNHLFTDHGYCRGSVRLTPDFSRKHDDTDLFHMNADYGAAVLQSVLARVR